MGPGYISKATLKFLLCNCALTCCFSVSCATAQTTGGPTNIYELWTWYKNRGDSLISDIRPKLRAVLSPDERAIESSVDYRIIISGNNNAFARRNRETIITAGFLQVIDSVATNLSAAINFGTTECLSTYLVYLTDGTLNNNWLVAHKQPPQPVAMALAFWNQRPDQCGHLNELRFRSNAKADIIREGEIYSSLIYLIAHELSHHINRDPEYTMVSPELRRRHLANGLDVTKEVTPSEQAVKERRADLFAFKNMMKMGYPPVGAEPVLFFFMGIEGFSIEQTEEADHPAAAARFLDMIEESSRDPEFMAVAKQMHKEEEWNAFVAQLRALLDHH